MPAAMAVRLRRLASPPRLRVAVPTQAPFWKADGMELFQGGVHPMDIIVIIEVV